MTPFARFALVFLIVVLVLCVFPHGPFAALGLTGGIFAATFGVIASIAGALFGLLCGGIGLILGLLALVPLLIPALILLTPLFLLVGLIALIARAARA